MPRRPTFALLLFLAACSATYEELEPEERLPKHARLGVVCNGLDSVGGFVKSSDGYRLHYRSTRGYPDRPVIVLIHGVFADKRTWRYVAGDLGSDHDLLLIDMLGCGLSDKPDPAQLQPDGYGPTAHARRVLDMVRVKTPGRRVVLVGHSLGGMVILRALGAPALRREYADVVERVDLAVLMASVDFALERTHPAFEELAQATSLKVAMATFFGVLRSRVADAMSDGADERSKIPREVVDQLAEALEDGPTRRAGQAMIRQAIPFEEGKPVWDKIEELVADYKNFTEPTLILWGARDETFGAAMGYKLETQLPDARLFVLEHTGHSIPTERPVESAAKIREFLGDGRASKGTSSEARAGN